MDVRDKKRKAEMGIPPRWLNCPRKGFLIADKFLPFKTPLSEAYDEQVPEECRFPPSMLLASLASYKMKMGLWIDLTNTSRFYDRKSVESTGIKYLKLQCRGHDECPSTEQTQSFIEICQKFISKHPLEIIGVHCTHGFNRTGFLIIAYLVESLSWGVEAAITIFNKARPPGIYKQDYLNALFFKYGEVEDTIQAPELPDWCNEDDNVDDDGILVSNENEAAECRPHKRRKEFIKKNPIFMEGVPGVVPVTSPSEISRIQRKCQAMCGWKSSGFPGSQPVSMDVNNLALLQKKPYKVSWKADGNRYMMLIDGVNKNYFIDRDNAVFQVVGLLFPRRKDCEKHICDTLLDGEMIIDKVDGEDVPRYLVYDIVKIENVHVGGTDFDRRQLCIAKEIIEPRRQAMADGRIDRHKEPFSMRAKDFWDITAAKLLLAEKFSKKMPHEVDGLIFQPAADPYKCGRCIDVLKWKPASLNSVDFKLKIEIIRGEGMLPEKKGSLFVGGYDRPFSTIKVNKTLKHLDGKIIECKFENGAWTFLRERTDKSFPNSYNTAMGVCSSIANPVTKEMLLNFIHNFRWQNPAKPDDNHPASGSIHSNERRNSHI